MQMQKEVHFSGTIDFIEYRERTRKEKNREMIGTYHSCNYTATNYHDIVFWLL